MKIKYSALDKLNLLFILISGVYAMIFWSELEIPLHHFIFRVLFFLLITVLALINQNHFTFLRTFYPLACLSFFYHETDYLNNFIFDNLDSYFAAADQWAFGFQPSLEFQKIFPSIWFSELMYSGYFIYYLLIFLTSFIIYLKSKESGFKAVFIVVCSFYIFYLFFYLVPVAGPQYYFSKPAVDQQSFRIFYHVITFIQDIAERPTAAFPSSHVAIAMIMIFISWKNLKTQALIITPFVILLTFSTVYIRAHYVIDVIAGIVISPFIFRLSEKVYLLFTGQKFA